MPIGRHDAHHFGISSGIFVRKFNIFAHNSKTNRDRDFVFDYKKGFGGMPNLVVILLMMSDSKWPTVGHFV